MKSNQGVFVAALLLSVAASGAHADQASISIGGCHTTSPQQGVVGPSIPAGYLFCGTIAGQPVCSPEIKTGNVPGSNNTDEYCSQLTSSGSGSLTVRQKTGCPSGQTGVIVERYGAASFEFTFKKNGVNVLPVPVSQDSPPGVTTLADFCFIAPPGVGG